MLLYNPFLYKKLLLEGQELREMRPLSRKDMKGYHDIKIRLSCVTWKVTLPFWSLDYSSLRYESHEKLLQNLVN